MTWSPKTRAGKALAAVAFVAASLTAIVTAYRTLDFDKPAWASDILRLEKQQLRHAIPSMEDRLDAFIIRRGKLEELPNNDYFRQEKRALDRRIENLQRDLGTAYERRNQIGD